MDADKGLFLSGMRLVRFLTNTGMAGSPKSMELALCPKNKDRTQFLNDKKLALSLMNRGRAQFLMDRKLALSLMGRNREQFLKDTKLVLTPKSKDKEESWTNTKPLFLKDRDKEQSLSGKKPALFLMNKGMEQFLSGTKLVPSLMNMGKEVSSWNSEVQFQRNTVLPTNRELCSYLTGMDMERFLMGKRLALSLTGRDRVQILWDMKLAPYPMDMGKEESWWNVVVRFQMNKVFLTNMGSSSYLTDTDMALSSTGTKRARCLKDMIEAKFRVEFPCQMGIVRLKYCICQSC